MGNLFKTLITLFSLFPLFSTVTNSASNKKPKPFIDQNIEKVETNHSGKTWVRAITFDPEHANTKYLIIVEQYEKRGGRLIDQKKIDNLPLENLKLSFTPGESSFISFDDLAIDEPMISLYVEYAPLRSPIFFLRCTVPVLPDRLGNLSCKETEAKPLPQ